jgi:hypothetical protein
MAAMRDRKRGLAFVSAGIVFVIVAVVLFGLRSGGGALDWVSIITAVAGLGMAIAGLYIAYTGGSTGAGLRPHAGS